MGWQIVDKIKGSVVSGQRGVDVVAHISSYFSSISIGWPSGSRNRTVLESAPVVTGPVVICIAKLPSCTDPRIHTSPGAGTTPAHNRSQGNPPVVGLGLGATVQLVPSKCSIRVGVAASFGGATGVEKPTAHTSFGASASTAFNLFVPPPTLGVATLFQFAPSQCIAAVSMLSESLNPTAQASFAASADAPNKNSLFDSTVVAVHTVPFQCSKSGETSPVPRFIRLPIAQTSFTELAVMAKTSA